MIQREWYMKKIRPFIDQEVIKVLTGIRRSGKSVMLRLIQKELLLRGVSEKQMVTINFEDMSLAHLCQAEKLHEEMERRISDIPGKAYLFFDEIQEVSDWEHCINSLRVKFDCDIYITGSNAKLLSGELASRIAGRYVEFVIYPFSFSEFVSLQRSFFDMKDDASIFKEYLLMGGMPYLFHLRYEEEPSRQYLQDIYNSVVLKDIVKRNNIRDVVLLERIILFVMTNVGTTFSANSLSKYMKNEGRKVAPETIANYIRFCEEAFLFYKVRREDLQGKKILSSSEKYYMVDHGIRESIFGGNTKDINLTLENIVYMELARRGYQIRVGKSDEKEIDFVCEKRGRKIYVQVCYLLSSDDVMEHEFGVYRQITDNFPKFVLSMDEFDMSRDGIVHLNIRDFLLKEDW